uniref:UBC core domain-containing protein n=1 Tax=Zea mays TaxID=4577 RepID=A0A804R7T1_MAIZE
MAATIQYNRSNPAVKRILQEVKEMQSNPSPDFMSLPLEEDIFEWQFAILGPRDSEFEGGIYHGRIQLPSDYPFKPPSFMLLTPSGRFEIQKKICLSISNYHPEHWQPSWSGSVWLGCGCEKSCCGL